MQMTTIMTEVSDWALPVCFPDPIDSFNAELTNEVPCLLTDVIALEDSIIVVDNENKKVKRFRRGKQIHDVVELEDPCGVARLLPSSSSPSPSSLSSSSSSLAAAQIVVTEPLQRQITFISTEGEKMSVEFYRRTRRRYQSICSLDTNRLVVGCCDIGCGSLDILNYEGIVLSTIEHDCQGNRLFRTPASIAAYPDAKHILVSDAGHRKLMCLDPDGTLEFIHDPEGIPSGVSVTTSGALFLCLYDKNQVHQLNAHCPLTCDDFMEDLNLKSPLAIHATDDMLFFTEEMPSGKVVVVNLTACAKKYTNKSVQLSQIQVNMPQSDRDEDSTKQSNNPAVDVIHAQAESPIQSNKTLVA